MFGSVITSRSRVVRRTYPSSRVNHRGARPGPKSSMLPSSSTGRLPSPQNPVARLAVSVEVRPLCHVTFPYSIHLERNHESEFSPLDIQNGAVEDGSNLGLVKEVSKPEKTAPALRRHRRWRCAKERRAEYVSEYRSHYRFRHRRGAGGHHPKFALNRVSAETEKQSWASVPITPVSQLTLADAEGMAPRRAGCRKVLLI